MAKFTRTSLAAIAAFSFVSIAAVPINSYAQNSGGIVSTAVALNDRQCRANYATMSPQQLINGGCYRHGSPFVRCAENIRVWEAIHTSTNSRCLTIWKDMAFNRNGRDVKYNETQSFRQVAQDYAYHLSKNSVFMETLSKLDQLELKKIAARAAGRFK